LTHLPSPFTSKVVTPERLSERRIAFIQPQVADATVPPGFIPLQADVAALATEGIKKLKADAIVNIMPANLTFFIKTPFY